MWKKAYEQKQREKKRSGSSSYSGGRLIGTLNFNNGVELKLTYNGGYVFVEYGYGSEKVGITENSGPYRRAVENMVRDYADDNGIRMPSIQYPWTF